MHERNIGNVSNGQGRRALIELGASVTLDGRRRGTLVGRSFDAKVEMTVYDVRVSGEKLLLNVAAARVKAAGPARRDVIGRDLPHNPKRPYLSEETGERFAA
jgi:hypothetical protein